MKIRTVDWRLDLDYSGKSFAGNVAIDLESDSDAVSLDARGLRIASARIDGGPTEFREDATRGTLAFPLKSPGGHRVEIDYSGAAAVDSLVGFYASPLGSGYALTSMMFPTGAGRLLPCIEHPSVKTVYRLVLRIDPDLVAIFNTPARSRRVVDRKAEILFEPTPPMSAYLLYLGVGPFDEMNVSNARWTVTVATSPGRAGSGRFSSEAAPRILAAYERFYRVPYPLPKLSLVAIENFWAGAMENWGAIAFRENLLLVEPSSSVRDRRDVVRVLAHEIAHQWFGNLVTPATWDDFWLNEAFATFAGHDITHELFPADDPWTEFLARCTAPALSQDALDSSHPIQVAVPSPDVLGEISDDITYGKGASVLRMVEAYLGTQVFRDGVSRYLERHQYGSAQARDLWDALTEVSGKPVDRVMAAWVTRPHFPLLHARWEDGVLTLRQERFRADGTPSPALWPIPLRVSTPHGEVAELMEGAEFRWDLPSPDGLRVNPERTAFARTHFEGRLFDRMRAEFPNMSPVDQWGFATDTFEFLYSGLASLDQVLSLVRSASSLAAPAPVLAVADGLRDLNVVLGDHPAVSEAAREFFRSQFASRASGGDRGPTNDTDRDLRELFGSRLAWLDSEFCREWGTRLPHLDREPPELQSVVLSAVAAGHGKPGFDALVQRLRATSVEAERVQILRALGHLHDPELIRRALGLIPSPGVTSSGAYTLVLMLAEGRLAGATLFDWYRENHRSLAQMWSGTPLLSGFLRLATVSMGIDRATEVRSFLEAETPAEATRAAREGIEYLELAQRLRDRVWKASGSARPSPPRPTAGSVGHP